MFTTGKVLLIIIIIIAKGVPGEGHPSPHWEEEEEDDEVPVVSDLLMLKRMSFMTWAMSPCTCSIVVLVESLVSLASCDSSFFFSGAR